ncbi:thiamine pyrophosphate-dependent enzyme [Bdellovibrionota bacterium FG-2]
METLTYLNSTNAEYVDHLRSRFEKDPESVDPSWRCFFEGVGFGSDLATSVSSFDAREVQIRELVGAYRESGVLVADLNPLASPLLSHPNLELSRFGLSEADLDRVFQSGAVEGLGAATLRDILGVLRVAYCGKIGWEFFEIRNPAERKWLEQQAESLQGSASLDAHTRIFILKRLTESEGFERFLHTRYVAQKRFSIEGGESLIPALDGLMESFAQQGATDFVLGMAHRGRLNVLVNVLHKKPEYIFTEFEGHFMADPTVAEGDVKYHLGYSCDSKTRSGQEIHLALASNPSHLEFVNPVVEGMVRARQTQLGDEGHSRIIPIVIHGDAALAGQGVCYETQGFSQVSGYSTGGTIHVVVNNQIGFTTDPSESRSTLFSTDLAKAGEAPVFHVNGDDPEAVWKAAFLAAQYRQKFHKDVYIDLVCYRRLGHNEGDEPAFTQPLLYKKIKAHPTTRDLYAQGLVSAQVVSADSPAAMVAEVTQTFSDAQARAKAEHFFAPHSIFEGSWKGVRYPTPDDLIAPVKTSVEEWVRIDSERSATKLRGIDFT